MTGDKGVQAQKGPGRKRHRDGSASDFDQLARDYAEASQPPVRLETENVALREQHNHGNDPSVIAVADAIEDLAIKGERSENADQIEVALADLQVGKPDAAIEFLRKILEHRKEEGETAQKEAARAARNIGAITYFHDTRESLEAYQESVALDADAVEAWNQLGHLRVRLGDLNGAVVAYEKMISLLDFISDREKIAVIRINLGIVYRTRAALEEAEAMYRKALDLNEELGRKEGMVNQCGNLGIVYRARGALDDAEAVYRKSLGVNEELGRKEGMASDYGNLAVLLIARGESVAGCAMLADAKRLFEEIGDQERLEQTVELISEYCSGETAAST
ncbi:MAG: hypothetical protein CMM52_16350 [Rhodospirillaceae bacterium]|nr:hypothetical protein [Rhodospirillaceae bacterium]|tara:strand:+ start:34111 stop:35115 length:1005 start_codon:yes stop_codon:yes gene_type:complete